MCIRDRHSTTGSLLDTYMLSSGHDRSKQASMRRDRPLPVERSSTEMSGATPMEEDYSLPCLDPVGNIPQ
eukprot:7092648-Karenia_brevis.AAC.1